MKRFGWSLLVVLALSFSALPLLISASPTIVWAQKSVHVKGYTTKTGKVVKPYDRKAPKSSGSTSSKPTKEPKTTSVPSTSPRSKEACATCPRDKDGRIARNESAKDEFMRMTGYPKGRPGYVVDHILPLACGGADVPSNMQWQTSADAKAKDKVERKGCKAA